MRGKGKKGRGGGGGGGGGRERKAGLREGKKNGERERKGDRGGRKRWRQAVDLKKTRSFVCVCVYTIVCVCR